MMLRVAALAGRKARADAAADLGQRLDVLGIARLLEPVETVRLELLRDRDRGRRAEAAVTVDQDLHLGADRVAHRGDRSTAWRISAWSGSRPELSNGSSLRPR